MTVIVVEKGFSGDSPDFFGKDALERLSLWVIPVTFPLGDESSTFQMLLDTGSQITILRSKYISLTDIRTTGNTSNVSGVGRAMYDDAIVDQLSIGDITFNEVTIRIGELPSQFDKYNIAGILGADILKHMSITLDYPQKRLEMKKRFVTLQ